MKLTHIFQRLRNWFNNHLTTNTGNGSGEQNTTIDLASTKGSRRESSYHTYYRIAGTRLDPEIKADWIEYKQSCEREGTQPKAAIGRRNQFLSARLKNEPPEFQEKVERERRDGTSTYQPGTTSSTVSDILSAENEADRIAGCRALQRYVVPFPQRQPK